MTLNGAPGQPFFDRVMSGRCNPITRFATNAIFLPIEMVYFLSAFQQVFSTSGDEILPRFSKISKRVFTFFWRPSVYIFRKYNGVMS